MSTGDGPAAVEGVSVVQVQPSVDHANAELPSSQPSGFLESSEAVDTVNGGATGTPTERGREPDSGLCQMNAWQSFGNRTYNIQNSFTSTSSSSGIQVCDDSSVVHVSSVCKEHLPQ